jgi:ABC-2 type transport system ATP-binding protein
MNYALELKNLRKEYAEFLLDDVSFGLPSGTIMGYIGANGAGKTTTIKLILDLLHKDGGDVFLFGEDGKKSLPLHKEDIGVVLDESNFPEVMNLKQVNAVMKHVYARWNSERFYELAKQFDLSESKTIKEFSHGMLKKLNLAVALSHDAKLLLLDEATNGLDPLAREEILDLFLEFIQDEEHSILISSHIVSDLEKICDYITFLHKGKVVFSEEKDVLLNEYALLKIANENLEAVRDKVIGYRKYDFGVEALVRKDDFIGEPMLDAVNIEDIMIYYTKENK